MPLKKNKNDDYIPIKCEGWNGKFAGAGNASEVSKVRRYNQQITDCRNFFGYETKEPEVLPTVWDGKFQGSKHAEIESQRVYGNQNRNTSFGGDIHGYTNETIILPTEWNGEFQLDPNDIRIKPERNASDNRDYMEDRLIKKD